MAIKTLESRYGGSRNQLMTQERAIEGWKTVRTTEDLDYFIMNVQNYASVFMEAGREEELSTMVFYNRIFGKLPKDMQSRYPQWRANKRKALFDYKALLQFCRIELSHRNELEAGEDDHRSSKKSFVIPEPDEQKPSAEEAIAAISKEFIKKIQSMNPYGKDLESRDCQDPYEEDEVRSNANPRDDRATFWSYREPPMCPHCEEKHWLTKCEWFLKSSAEARKAFIAKQKLCYNCFSNKHSARECPSKRTCNVEECGKKHHKLLHESKKARVNMAREDIDYAVPSSEDEEEVPHSHTYQMATQHGISLRVLPVTLYNPDTNKSKRYNALLDDGSQSTLISERIYKELGLKGLSSPYRLQGVAGQTEVYDSYKTMVSIRVSEGGQKRVLQLRTLPDPVGDLRPTDWNVWKEEWPHLRDICFPTIDQEKVDMLIGGDQADLISGHDIPGGQYEPVARKCILGWTVLGRLSPADGDPVPRAQLVYSQLKDIREASTPPFKGNKIASTYDLKATTPKSVKREAWDIEMAELVERQWAIDRNKEDDQNSMSRDEKRAVEQLKKSIKLKDGRCEAKCIWKVGEPSLPNNYQYTLSRFLSWERSKIMRNPAWKKEYHNVIESWISKGYVRKVPDEQKRPLLAYYLPTFGVLRPDKDTTKLRVVVDAKAKYNNKSLNDAILSGPNLINDLVTVLLRFRHKPIAIQADISEMFLQVSLAPEDRVYHRFLHRPNPDLPIEEYEFQVHAFGNSGSPTVAIHTINEEARRRESEFPLACQTILKSTLVDDNLDSFDTKEEAIEVIRNLKEIYGGLLMSLGKIASNNKDVVMSVPEGERAKAYTTDLMGDLETMPTLKALGVIWQAEADIMSFEELEMEDKGCTKRTILRAYARLFDPLGFVLPFVVQARILFQECWTAKLDWDDETSPEIAEVWKTWLEALEDITKVAVPRCLVPDSLKAITKQLHVFADASHKAYAAVAYIRSEYQDGSVGVTFAYAKGRVAPLKKITIPRLELQGAVLATEVARTSWEATGLSLKETTFWIDNMNVMWWLTQSNKSLQEFVANRVQKILDRTKPDNWRWVNTEDNPADIASRGYNIAQLLAEKDMWWKGPDFLKEEPGRWPNTTWGDAPEAALQEVKKAHRQGEDHVLTSREKEALIELERFQTWRSAVRSLAWALKFIKRVQSKSEDDIPRDRITAEEYKKAEDEILRQIQREAFGTEIRELTQGRTVARDSRIYKLRPELDTKGNLRIMSKLRGLQHMKLERKCPLILPKNHRGSELIAKHYHQEVLHHVGGTNHTLSEMNKRYWMIAGRQRLRTIIRECVHCRRRKKFPTRNNMPDAPLPQSRVPKDPMRAFENVTIDVAGPFILKERRSRVKRYGVIFSCLVYRGIHTEVASKLDTDSFLMALERFVATRGRPSYVKSDNGTNFRGGNEVLKELWSELDRDRVQAKYPEIKWDFTAPRAPHTAGVIERMVQKP